MVQWYQQNFTGLTYDDVLLVPQCSELKSRQDPNYIVKIEAEGWKYKVAPIIVSNMRATANFEMIKALASLGIVVPTHRFQSIEKQEADINKVLKDLDKIAHKVPIAGSVGLLEDKRTEMVLSSCDWIFLELAHADSKKALEKVKEIKEKLSRTQMLIVGNVCTSEAAFRLEQAGAHIVKVGVGPGAVCSTRMVTGTGFPQFSAVDMCSNVASVIADGGIKTSGDITKALAAGADFVMIGSLFAGTDEASGKRIRGTGMKVFYGSASESNGHVGTNNVPEGVTAEVPYMGSAMKVAEDLLKGVRQGMAMVGAKDLDELRAKAKFIRVTPAGTYEGTPHILGR
jgi:IMP dehydrogenase